MLNSEPTSPIAPEFAQSRQPTPLELPDSIFDDEPEPPAPPDGGKDVINRDAAALSKSAPAIAAHPDESLKSSDTVPPQPPPPPGPPDPSPLRTQESIAELLKMQRREGSIPSWRVIEQELSLIRPALVKDLRSNNPEGLKEYLTIRRAQLLECGLALGATACGESKAAVHARHDKIIEEALSKLIRSTFIDPRSSSIDSIPPLCGLTLSGGGIRSATLGLGVLQTLARSGRLRRFDYLSTVSGGGYTGAWFKAWLYRLLESGVNDPMQAALDEIGKRPDATPIFRLREFSNFLSPRIGALSADTWTLIALASRNLLLNWIMFIPLGLLAVALPWMLFMLGTIANTWARHQHSARVCLAVAGAIFFVSALVMTTVYVARTQLYDPVVPPGRSVPAPRGVSQPRFVVTCGVPLVIGAVLFAIAAPADYLLDHQIKLIVCLLAIAGAVSSGFNARAQKLRWGLAGLLGGLTLAGGIVGSHTLLIKASEWCPTQIWLFSGLWLAVPLALLSATVAATIFIGFSSTLKDATDLLHEWWSRFGGWLLLFVACWLVGIVVTVLIPQFILTFRPSGFVSSINQSLTAGGGLIGIITAAIGFFDTSSPSGTRKPTLAARARAFLLPIGAAIFAIAVFVGSALVLLMIMHGSTPAAAFVAGGAFRDDAFALESPLTRLAAATLILTIVLLFAARLINYSRFTLHAIYRERLVRAYLGASNTKRNPDRFTGFDPDDNIRLHEMRAYGPGRYSALDRPFHLLNMTLNLTSTSRLDWQERKGESFTASILHAGTRFLGYQDVRHYAGPPRFGADLVQHTGMTLGAAVAASGAAASPNMGYNSSSLVAFLLTIFNIRLGVWLPNPGPDGVGLHDRSGPRWALLPALSELFGVADDQSAFVNITDGGHFDNMGIYELVRRGVRIIVCVDGECDNVSTGSPFMHEGLAQSIRKCSIDLGVEIRSNIAESAPVTAASPSHAINLRTPFGLSVGEVVQTVPPPAPEWNKVLCPRGYWLARIHYPGDALLNDSGERASATDPRPEPGYLLYIKPVLFGDLPVDLRNYHASNPDFPQQTTADQWFSESQFESYRKLGAHLATEIPPHIWKKIGL